MIKVPATEAGVPAIEELTARGINVNVTLLFSVARYEQVIDAYLTGLERRARRGDPSTRSPRWPRSSSRASMPRPTPCSRPARTCAVASRSPTPASPTPATATASPTRAGSPCAKPAPTPQRPLWASTATKDPAYSDVLYVEELIAPDVINTMPEATLRAFADHGDASRAFDPSSAAAAETLRTPRTPASTSPPSRAQLEREGVRSFCDSYRDLLACIETKLAAHRRPSARLAQRR